MPAAFWTLPNILTVSRVVAAPGVALAFALLPRPAADWVALLLFVGAALTDFLDGLLARRWNQISGFGRMLDPIADKVMVSIALAVLCALHGPTLLILLPAGAILLREGLISGLREFLKGDAALSVTRLAKWKTTAQLVAVALMLAPVPAATLGLPAALVSASGFALLWLAAALTLITDWDYMIKALPYLEGEQSREADR
jgi:CDP-diacylglycerol--glycerol-3-phosphate 3-phosphatidyltransferase